MKGLKTETKVFSGVAGELDDTVGKINEYLKDKTNTNISYHNVPGAEYTYVIATVTVNP